MHCRIVSLDIPFTPLSLLPSAPPPPLSLKLKKEKEKKGQETESSIVEYIPSFPSGGMMRLIHPRSPVIPFPPSFL